MQSIGPRSDPNPRLLRLVNVYFGPGRGALLQQQHDQRAANRQKRIGDSETNGEAERWHATTGRILNDRQRDG
jgi:hypothetical protein